MQIQSQAVDIKQGVIDIKLAVNILTQQVISSDATKSIQNSPLNNFDATKEQIQKTIDNIPNEASCGVSIYLHQEHRGPLTI